MTDMESRSETVFPTMPAVETFRTDIEGLRAVCVLAVVFYHAFPTWLPGGFVGVDLFFVISGFLITGLLASEIERSGSIDLLGFWERRVRRILPAATFVLCSVALLISLFPALDARMLGRHVAAAALFYHNIRQAWASVDYLGGAHDENPLLHYWSLSVEEQFYAVWPLLLVAILYLVRRSWRFGFFALAGSLGVVSFAWSVYLTETSPTWAFFGTPSRAWQLMSGAALALSAQYIHPRTSVIDGGLAALALLTLAASFLTISGELPYPGLTAALPTLAAVLLIHANRGQGTIVAAGLSVPALRYVGRVSFSWYLWHWPMLVFGKLAFGDSTTTLLSMIVLSFVLAVLTFHLVEQPFRQGRRFRPSFAKTYAMGGLFIALSLGTGVAMRFMAPDSVYIGGGVHISGAVIKSDRPRIYSDRCLLRFVDVASPECVYGTEAASRTVLLLGDSHAGNWFSALDAAAKKEGWRLVVRIKASCRPIDAQQQVQDSGRKRPYTECGSWLAAVMNEIESISPDVIVVAGTRHNFPVGAERRIIDRLARVGRTIVMRDTPWFPQGSVECLRSKGDPEQCSWPLDNLLKGTTYPRIAEDQLPEGSEIVDLNGQICPQGVCRAVLDGQVVMFDRHHMTASFARSLAVNFQSILKGGRQ